MKQNYNIYVRYFTGHFIAANNYSIIIDSQTIHYF